MTADDVRRRIEEEVAGDWSLTNMHGCDLRRCLVPPQLREYDDCSGGSSVAPIPVVRLWLVLEERTEDRSGYKIVYSEQAGEFGLAVSGSQRDVCIGYYGSFLDTYRAM